MHRRWERTECGSELFFWSLEPFEISDAPSDVSDALNFRAETHTQTAILKRIPPAQALVNILPTHLAGKYVTTSCKPPTLFGELQGVLRTLILFSTYSSLKTLQLFLIPSMIAPWRFRFGSGSLKVCKLCGAKVWQSWRLSRRRLLWIAIRPQ